MDIVIGSAYELHISDISVGSLVLGFALVVFLLTSISDRSVRS